LPFYKAAGLNQFLRALIRCGPPSPCLLETAATVAVVVVVVVVVVATVFVVVATVFVAVVQDGCSA
jgi:hypothetical protein